MDKIGFACLCVPKLPSVLIVEGYRLTSANHDRVGLLGSEQQSQSCWNGTLIRFAIGLASRFAKSASLSRATAAPDHSSHTQMIFPSLLIRTAPFYSVFEPMYDLAESSIVGVHLS